LLVLPVVVHGQAALWKTYFEAGRKAYDEATRNDNTFLGDKEIAKASFAEARKRFELARMEAEAFGPQDPRLAITLSWLVTTYLKENNFAAADPIAKKLLDLWRANPGLEIKEVADALARIGHRYYQQAKYAEAEQFYDLGLAIVEKLPANSPHRTYVLEFRYDLAGVYLYQNKLDASVRNLTEILDPAIKAYGAKTNFVGQIYARLGTAYEWQRKYADAETSYRHAFGVFVETKNLRWIFTVLDDLNGMFRGRGEYASSEQLLKPVVAALEKEPLRQKDLAKYSSALGLSYMSQEKFDQAAATFERVRKLYQEKVEANDVDQATIRNNIAKAYYYLRKYSEAEPLYREAIDLSRRATGNDNADTIWFEKNYALLLYARGEKERADPLFQKAINKYTSQKDDGRFSLAISWFELGELYRRQERYAEAEPLLKQALELRQKFMEPDHLDLALTMERYATTLRMLGRQPEALKLEEQALAIRSKHTRQN
jgi:tetratricopeptide (TPR) repeat protein